MKTNLIITAICAMTALPAAAQDVTADTVVATVNGEDITMTHVLEIHRQLPPEYASLPAATLFDGIVGQLVQQRAMAAAVTDEPEWLDEALTNARASLLAGLVMREVTETPVSDEALQSAYDDRFADFVPSQEFNASHILVETEEEAQSVITTLEGGADFAETAQEVSTGPSGPRGGELGWFGAGMMVAPFEAAVQTLEVGEVSGPVQTQFGWHVIKLNDSREMGPPPLEEVRADLEGEITSLALQERMAALTEAADVTRVDGIDPSVLDTLDIFGQ